MDSTIIITPFEEQVMQSLVNLDAKNKGCNWPVEALYQHRLEAWGPHWGGPVSQRAHITLPLSPHNYANVYPSLNMALGRLRNKGLVERVQWHNMREQGYAAHLWTLTEKGRELMGLE